MANTRKFRYEVGFDIDKKSADILEKELNKLINIRPNDLAKIRGGIADQYKEDAKKINNYAHEIKMAMEAAYNPKLKTTNIEVFNKILKQSGINLKEISQIFANSGAAGTNTINLLTNSMTKFNVKIKESHKLLNSLGRTLTNTLKWNLSATLINKVSGSIQQAWGFSKNLQESLTNIRIVTGKSADEMRKFAQEANKAAAQLGRTTTDYTKASLIYAQQGLSDAEIKKRSEITLKTANVTGQSADKVSEELTAVWNGYKVTAKEAEIYIDRLAAVASKTASNLQELSTGMSKVAAAAASLGVGEDQLAAQLATIISVTRQAPETVGTALKTIYSRITDIKAGIDEDGTTLGTYSKKLSTMGINVLDATGNLRNMGQVMEEIGSKWSSFSKQQQVYIAQTMAGQRQYTNLIALFDNYQDKYVSALNTARNASGTLNKQNSVYLEDINTKITQLTTSTEKLWMNLIDTDSFKGIIEGLTTIIQKVDVLFQSLGGGGAILESVSSIALRIMSRSAATEINTFLNNREQGIAQKEAVKQQIQKTQESYDAMVDKNSPQAMVLREKLNYLPNMAYFSKDQYTEINKLFDEMTLAGVNSENAEEQKKFYDSLIKKFGNINQSDFKKMSFSEITDKMTNIFYEDAETFQRDYVSTFSQASDNFLEAQEKRQQERNESLKKAKNNVKKAKEDQKDKQTDFKNTQKDQQEIQKQVDEINNFRTNEDEKIQNEVNKKRGQLSYLKSLGNITKRKKYAEENSKNMPKEIKDLKDKINKLEKQQQTAILNIDKKNVEIAKNNAQITKLEDQKLETDLTKDQRKKINSDIKALKADNKRLREGIKKISNNQNTNSQLLKDYRKDYDQKIQSQINDKIDKKQKQLDSLPTNKKDRKKEVDEITKQQFPNQKDLKNNLKDAKENTKNKKAQSDEATKAREDAQKILNELEEGQKKFQEDQNKAKEKNLGDRKKALKDALSADLVTKYMNIDTEKYDSSNLKQAQKLKKELEKLNIDEIMSEEDLKEAEQKFVRFFEFLRENASQLEAEFQNSYMETLDKMESQVKRQKENLQQIYDQASSAMREAIIDGTIQLVGAVGQLQSSLQGLVNIGNIWEDENVSFGEKLLKTFSNLIITIPLLINGVTSIRSNFQKTRNNIIGFSKKRQETKNEIDEAEKKYDEIHNVNQKLKQERAQKEQNNEKEKNKKQEAAELTKEIKEQAANEEKKAEEIKEQAANEKKKTKETEKQAANEEKKTEETEEQAANEGKKPKTEEPEEDENEELDLDEVTGGATGKAKTIVEQLKGMGGKKLSEFGNVLTEQLPSKGFNIATGVGGAIAGAGMVAMQMWQENINNTSQNTIEKNNKIIESESQLQQKMANAANSIHELNEQYKQGILTRQETKNTLFELAKQYDAEINIVDELANSYNDLAKALQNVERREKIRQVNSMDRQINAEKDNLKQSMRHAHYGNQASYMLSSAWADKMETLHLGMNGEWTTDSSRQALDFINFMESRGHKQSAFSMPGDQLWQIGTEEQAYKFYKDAAQFNKKYGNVSGFNKSIQEMLEQNSDTIKKIDEEKYQNAINKASIGANDAKKLLNATNNYNDFVKEKQDIENSIRDSIVGTYEEATPEEIENMVQNIMATTFQGSQIYAKYNRTAEAEKALSSHFGGASLTSYAQDLLLNMNSQQLAVVENLNFDYIDNMVQLESIFEKIANKDYSAVKDFSNISFKNLANINTIWDQIYKKVSSNQIIFSQDYEKYKQSGLFSSIEDFDLWWKTNFKQDANGNYTTRNVITTKSNILTEQHGKDYEDKTYQAIRQSNDKKRIEENEFSPKNIKEATNISKQDVGTLITQIEGFSTLKEEDKLIIEKAKDYIESIKNKRKIFQKEQEKLDKSYEQLGDIYTKVYSEALKHTELSDDQQTELLENKYWMDRHYYDSDIDLNLMTGLAQRFRKTAQASNLLSNSLENNENMAVRVSNAVLRYNNALQNTLLNISTWKTQLTSGSDADKINLLPILKNTYADLLDLDESVFSNNFLLNVENLNLLQQAAVGVSGAYDKLLAKTQQGILINIEMDTDTENTWNKFKNQINQGIKQLKIGEAFNGDILDSAKSLYTSFKDMGVPIELIYSLFKNLEIEIQYDENGLIRISKAADRAFKNANMLSETVKSIAKLQADRLAAHQKLDKYLEDERDLYHDINREISSIDRNLSRIKTKQQNLTGIELYNNLNKQNAELKTKGKKLEQKNKLQQQDLINSRNKLGKYGVTFNENGQISNYMSVLAEYENQINNVIKRKNQIKNSMNAWTAADGDKNSDYYINLQNELRKADEQYDEINDKYSMLKTSISKYDSLLDQHENTIDTQSEILRQQIQNNIQQFDLKVSVQLDLSSAEKEWEDFKKNVLNRDDLLNPSNTITLKQKDVNEATVNYQNRMKDSQAISSSLLQVFTEINNFNKAKENGTIYQSNLFNSVSEAYTKLQELQTQGKEALKDAAEYADIIKQAYLDAFTYIQEEFNKQDKYYNFISEQLKHDISLIDLVYGSRGGEYKDSYYNQINDFEMDRLDMLKKQQDFWAKQEAAAISEASKKIAHENWETVTNNLNSITESVIQNLKTKFQNMIDTIVNKLENSLTDGHGFDYITMEWDILKKHADMYLDTVNSAFAIKNIEYLFNQAINDTTGLKNQQNLKKVMEEQMNILKEKDKLTKYDVDRAEKVLEIEKARIALEEARNNKTTMRLKRDSSGNYSYQFTADENAIDKAQNDLYKAQNDLYNFDLQAWRSNNENAVAVFKDAINQIAEIRKNDNLSEEQKQEKIALIQKETQEKMTFYARENNFIRANLEQSTYNSMADLMDNSTINYSNMIQGMNSESQNFINKFNSDPDSVMNMFNEAIQNMEDKSEEYNIQIENVVKTAKGNFEELKEATDPIVENEAAMVTKNDELIDSMDKTISKVSGWVASLGTIESSWQGVYDKTEEALTKAQEYIKYWKKQFLGKTQDEIENNGSSDQGGGKNSGGTDYKDPGKKGTEGLFKALSQHLKPPLKEKGDDDLKYKKPPLKPDSSTYSKKVNKQYQQLIKADTFQQFRQTSSSDWFKASETPKDMQTFLFAMFDEIDKLERENVDKFNSNEKTKNLRTAYDKAVQKYQWNAADFDKEDVLSASEYVNFILEYLKWKDNKKYEYLISQIGLSSQIRITERAAAEATEKAKKTEEERKKQRVEELRKIGNEIRVNPLAGFKYLNRFDTGGYTGNWNSSDGRLAVLHEKELVLNKNDTANMLKIVQASRNIIDMVQSNVLSVLSSQIQQLNSTWDSTKAQVNKYNQETTNNRLDTQKLNQQVSIEANFPNVTNRTEIQEAFSDLVNLATQKALNYNKN